MFDDSKGVSRRVVRIASLSLGETGDTQIEVVACRIRTPNANLYIIYQPQPGSREPMGIEMRMGDLPLM